MSMQTRFRSHFVAPTFDFVIIFIGIVDNLLFLQIKIHLPSDWNWNLNRTNDVFDYGMPIHETNSHSSREKKSSPEPNQNEINNKKRLNCVNVFCCCAKWLIYHRETKSKKKRRNEKKIRWEYCASFSKKNW